MYDIAIIGCGITGAACAYMLSKYNISTLILEKENDVACGATKANSAIIHAGFDPAVGSLMAKLNVRGAALAREICALHSVPYDRTGSLVLAFNEDDKKTLDMLYLRGTENGVEGMKILDASSVKELEPEISDAVTAALYAPSAVVSPWDYCLALAETAVFNGAKLMLETELISVEKTGEGFLLETNAGSFESRFVINAAGVNAETVHNMAAQPAFKILPDRGQYYLMDKIEGCRVRHTVFQCPGKNGKGVLVSPTVHGNLIIGPNSEPVEASDDKTTADGLDLVKKSAQKSVPSIDFRSCIKNFAGVRARSDRDDFIIEEAKDARGFIDAAGICSPGLSAAPAIGEMICGMLKDMGLELKEKTEWKLPEKPVRFLALSPEEKNAIIAEDPSYGRVICRCETITEGEMRASFRSPIPPRSVDAVKRRTGGGLGRCQGGFCGPSVVRLLAEEQGVSMDKILLDQAGTWMLVKREER